MKRLFLLLMLPLLAITLNSCSKNDDGGDDASNKLTINGKSYNFTGGGMSYEGNYYSENSEYIDLTLDAENGVEMDLEFSVPNGSKKLIAGTYNFSRNYDAFTFNAGYIWNGSDEFDIIGGTVTVAISGNTYTITLNCAIEGGTVKGTYKGSLILKGNS